MLLISLPSALRFIRLNVFGHSPCGALIHPIFNFENSHYINITPVFKAKTRNKISYPKFVNLFLHRSLENGGWQITDDPLFIELKFDGFPFQIDIGAEKLIKAIKKY